MLDKKINQKNCSWPFYTFKPVTDDKDTNELLVIAECVSLYSNNFYNNFLKNKNSDLICPKLDNKSECVYKLAEIIKKNNLGKITTVKLDLKCCGYLTNLVETALKLSGKNIPLTEKIINQKGNFK